MFLLFFIHCFRCLRMRCEPFDKRQRATFLHRTMLWIHSLFLLKYALTYACVLFWVRCWYIHKIVVVAVNSQPSYSTERKIINQQITHTEHWTLRWCDNEIFVLKIMRKNTQFLHEQYICVHVCAMNIAFTMKYIQSAVHWMPNVEIILFFFYYFNFYEIAVVTNVFSSSNIAFSTEFFFFI